MNYRDQEDDLDGMDSRGSDWWPAALAVAAGLALVVGYLIWIN